MTSRFSYGVSGTCGYSGSYGYSYGALTSQQAAHSREASRHSALSHPSYPPSVRSRRRTSTDEQHPRFELSSHAHTRESSAVGRRSSVEDEGAHSHRRRHNEVRHSEETRRRSIDHQKHCHHPHQSHLCVPDPHHLHHAHHTPHCHLHQRYDPQTRQFQYSSSVPKDIKFPELVQSKVVAVKSKNNDTSWHRISQSMGLAKEREHDRLEEMIPSPTVLKVKKKKKWKWRWGKKKEKDPVEPEHHDDVYNAPKNKEPEMMVRQESRPVMLEWLGGESLPVQSPQDLKELFEREY